MSVIILNKKIFTGTSSNVDEPEAGMLSMGIDIDGKLKVKEDDGNVYTIGDTEPFIGLSYSRLDIGTYVDNVELISKINNSEYRFLNTNDILFISGLNTTQFGSYYEKYILTINNVSIGTLGTHQVVLSDLELINSTNLSTISNIQDIIDLINPNAIRYDLGLQVTDIIEDIVNNSGPFTVGLDDDIYFTFNTDIGSYIYRFLITDPGDYGIGEIQVDSNDFLLIYSSISEQYIEGTYDEIYDLKQNSSLVPNRNYIITDYVNEYIINGTDTSRIVNEITSIGAVSGYAQFQLSEALPIGTPVELTGLPTGYVGPAFIGMTGVITNVFGTQYYIFSNLPEILGMTIKYTLPRYSVEFDEVTILDTFGKPICKPGGVLNTEVHDSLSYGTMSNIENMAPPIERIVLTAISTNKFSENAFSDTFEGDFLLYDINDNIITDLNGNFVKYKKGTITRRWNNVLNIDVDKDWRSQKYRRYRTTDVLFDRYKFLEEVYKVQNTSGLTYSTGGIPTQLYNSPGHRYTLLDLENKKHLNDFTEGNPNGNIFSASTNTANLDTISLFQTYVWYYVMDFNVVQSGLMFKDFNIIPLDGNYEPITKVKYFKVKNLENSVFMNNNNYSGTGPDLTVQSESSKITNSTILSTGTIENDGYNGINELLTFDLLSVKNSGGLINRLCITNRATFYNSGEIHNCTFGCPPSSQSIPQGNDFTIDKESRLFHSIFSGSYSYRNDFISTNMHCCFFHFGVSLSGKYRITGHLTAFREGNYSLGTSFKNVDLYINTGFDKNPNKVNSYGYDFKLVNNGSLNENSIIRTMDDTRELYKLSVNSGIISTTVVSTPN